MRMEVERVGSEKEEEEAVWSRASGGDWRPVSGESPVRRVVTLALAGSSDSRVSSHTVFLPTTPSSPCSPLMTSSKHRIK